MAHIKQVDTFVPSNSTFFKKEAIAVVLAVAAIGLALILGHFEMIKGYAFIGTISGASVLTALSLVALVKKHHNKYHLSSDEIGQIQKQLSMLHIEAGTETENMFLFGLDLNEGIDRMVSYAEINSLVVRNAQGNDIEATNFGGKYSLRLLFKIAGNETQHKRLLVSTSQKGLKAELIFALRELAKEDDIPVQKCTSEILQGVHDQETLERGLQKK